MKLEVELSQVDTANINYISARNASVSIKNIPLFVFWTSFSTIFVGSRKSAQLWRKAGQLFAKAGRFFAKAGQLFTQAGQLFTQAGQHFSQAGKLSPLLASFSVILNLK